MLRDFNDMMHRFLYTVSAICLLAVPLSSSAVAAGDGVLQARAEANWRYGQERSILMSEFWVPIAQNSADGSVLYGDVRMMGDDHDNREFNIGVGYRKMVRAALVGEGIAGAHLWFDHRLTDRGSRFNQVTAGLEWLGDRVDVRLNGYLPLNDSNTFTQANPNASAPGFAGNGIVVNTDQTVVEESLPGLDLEFGLRVPFMDSRTDSTRAYVGGYHFEGDRSADVSGWRARFVSDVTSDIQVGARFQRDGARGSQGFLEATVRFPLNQKKSYRTHGLRARLDESPERDIDIVSNEAFTDDGNNKALLNAATGAVQAVIHVDNTAAGGGDGSAETPFNTLAAAEGAAGTDDLIYVHRGDGTTAGQAGGITLNDTGQMLIGAGSALTFNGDRFATSNGNAIAATTIIPADPLGAPVITNGGGNGVDVAADRILLSGFTVDGSADRGVSVYNNSATTWDSVTIENVTSQNNASYGIRVQADGAGSAITEAVLANNFADTNGNAGFLAYANNGGLLTQARFTNNTAKSNTNYGFWAYATGGGTLTQVDYTGNTAQNNTSNGYVVRADAGSAVTKAVFTNNLADTNGSSGYGSYVNGGGTLGTIEYSGNTAKNNTDRGFYLRTSDVGSVTSSLTLTGNLADANQYGYYVYASGGGVLSQADFTNNTAKNQTLHGFRAEVNGAGSAITKATFTDNTANANGYGYLAYANNGGTLTQATFTNNTAQTNTNFGFWAFAISGGTLTQVDYTGNTAKNNTTNGYYASTTGTSTIGRVFYEGNTATGNAWRGFAIDDDSTGSITADLGGGAFGSAGNNRAFDNGTQELAVDLDGGTLKAENNWWGNAAGLPGGELDLQDGSAADTTPFLTTDPGAP